MLDRVITHADLLTLIDELGRKRRIIGPVARRYADCDPPIRYFYEEVDRAEQLDLGFNYAVYGPKRFLFPPKETLFTFRRHDGAFDANPVIDARPMAFVGVHPCDIHAIRLLDQVFNDESPDEHYLTRRSNTMIIGIDCPKPCTDGVFCRDMGCHEAAEGFDVMLCPLTGDNPAAERRYGVIFGTKAGREWLLYSRRNTPPTAADERTLDTYRREKAVAFPFALTTRKEQLPTLLGRSYDSLLWEATARRCYSCASCNLSCPTCYCFDVSDELDMTLAGGARTREWDGCQLSGFAMVAGDHNFRAKAASRLRHRIYRKALWIEQRSGRSGCVGCARCDRACTAKINSVEIYNQLAEEV